MFDSLVIITPYLALLKFREFTLALLESVTDYLLHLNLPHDREPLFTRKYDHSDTRMHHYNAVKRTEKLLYEGLRANALKLTLQQLDGCKEHMSVYTCGFDSWQRAGFTACVRMCMKRAEGMVGSKRMPGSRW